MRLIQIFLLLFFMVAALDASYLRSIRVSSFATEQEAKEALVNLQAFILSQDNIVKLQKENGFIYKYRKSGDYFLLLIEPLRERAILQEVLDTLRTQYTDVYVVKLSAADEKKYALLAQNSEKLQVQTQEITKQLPLKKVKVEKTQDENRTDIIVKTAQQNYEKEIHVALPDVNETAARSEQTQVDSEKSVAFISFESGYLLEIALIVAILLNILFVRFLFVYRRDIESFTTKEMMYQAKVDHYILEIKNKEKLIYQVSHELRTPMTAIMGLSHIILNTQLNKSQADNIKRIESSAEYLLSILNDILDMSKIQAGELKLENVEFNINDVLDYAFNTIAVDAKNKKLAISMKIAEDVPSHIIGDSLRLRQILINLLGNSIKFTKKGGVNLGIKRISDDHNSIKLEFTVTDTGIGMTPSQIETLFKSFTQAEVSISREYGGTGLGLAISKQLIDMMHGDIRVESEKDSGTSFIFTLVFKVKDPQNKRNYRLPSIELMNKRVLLVDADNERAVLIKKMLGYFKYNTHIIPSFEQTVMDPSIVFDIIIIHETSLSRYSVDKIKEFKKKHNSKTVFLSEIHSELNNHLMQDIEIDSYLQIPFNQQSMLTMIEDVYNVKNLDNISKKKIDKSLLKSLSGKKILVAEDNKINQKVIAGLLLDTGIELQFVENGQEAIEFLVTQSSIDLILMDINMPIMNGHEASKEIRKDRKYDSIPIIALTADVMDKSIEDAMLAGMQGHISKPIIVDIFYKKLLDLLSYETKSIAVAQAQTLNKTQENKSEFEELSISVGLERCENDTKFYRSILEDFKNMYGESPKLLTSMCTEGNFKEARRIAMDIKDVTLNIGAYHLCESAAALEYEFEKGARSNCVQLIEMYDTNLQLLFKDVDKYIEKFFSYKTPEK
ncbi:MAG: ATP-binding protein [Sulfurimonas sp.]|nr:ATP-binding protein [Sulfurimonas sp.]